MDKNSLKLSFIYIGTVIGAGFASGREIIEFFGIYGYKGILGVILAGILFSFIGAFILSSVYKNKIQGYSKFLNKMFGKKLAFVFDTIISLSLFIGFSIMLSGSGAVFNEGFNLPYEFGVIVMDILCFITFIFGIEGISFVNSILVPILIFGIVLLSSNIMLKEGFVVSNGIGNTVFKGDFILSSIVYTSYNSLLVFVVLSSLFPIIPNKKTAIKGGVLGGVILCLLALFILLPCLILYEDIYFLDIPMLRICEVLGENSKKMFGIILWASMFTTAVSNGFGFIEKTSLKGKNKTLYSFIFCSIAIPFTNLGFSKLVATMYPLMGYLAIVIFIFMIVNYHHF
jgi:uncharacterized membrane protein YkvI